MSSKIIHNIEVCGQLAFHSNIVREHKFPGIWLTQTHLPDLWKGYNLKKHLNWTNKIIWGLTTWLRKKEEEGKQTYKSMCVIYDNLPQRKRNG